MKLSRHICTQAVSSFDLLDKDKDGQFHLYDADGDDVVNEAESKLILDSMIATQKAVMTEIFATHVESMPKKHEKLFTKSLSEEDFKSKIPEKKVEFPELHNLLAVYAKGFYDERFTFYERKQERNTRYKGLLLAAAIGLGDYIAAVI
ncbi:hypothetical protein AM588_10005608 [Phytophthora nicotianae]|uniref:Uncharacterized protein n=1 Tax=Phytophthora nicotianae TaxID=4792 RepID=A0A0W8D0V8_PHYNI|nr:hypothetical protein AM588_10005608 [Phytophthora nicotianae]